MVKAKKAAAANGIPRRGAQATYAWREYHTQSDGEDVVPYLLRVRSDIRQRDADQFVFTADALMTDVWNTMAPYVVDWNVDDDDGNPVPPPAEAGGQQFDYLPNQVFWAFFNDLKFRSSGTVDSKPWKPSASTDGSTSDGSTTTTS